MDDAISFAKKYTEDLLSFFGLNLTVNVRFDGEVIQVDIPSTEFNGFLIGSNADTLRSFQNIVGSSLRNQGYEESRINLDIAGYKKTREDRLAETASAWIEEVKSSGQPKHLEPMNPADRRVIHQAASQAGVATHSEGEGRDRHIVLG